MNTTKSMGGEIERATALNVVIAFDDVRAGKKAKELCDRLARRLNPNCELHISLWSLSVLHLPQILQAAARQAARAALVVIAANGQTDLTLAAKTWVTMFSTGRTSADGALAVLFHGASRACVELAPSCAFLKRAARTAGRAFFSQVIDSGDDGPYSFDSCRLRANTRTALLRPTLGRA
jgi:hypothetical protein